MTILLHVWRWRMAILLYSQKGQEYRVNHSINVNSTCIRTVFKIQVWNLKSTSMTPRKRSWRGWRFYLIPRRVGNKGLTTQKTWFGTVFKIQIWNVTCTSATPPREVANSTLRRFYMTILLHVGQEYRVNHSINVNSTCIRTVFKIHSWNFTGMSKTLRDRLRRGWRYYPTPGGVRNKGLTVNKSLNIIFDVHSQSFQDTELKLHNFITH